MHIIVGCIPFVSRGKICLILVITTLCNMLFASNFLQQVAEFGCYPLINIEVPQTLNKFFFGTVKLRVLGLMAYWYTGSAFPNHIYCVSKKFSEYAHNLSEITIQDAECKYCGPLLSYDLLSDVV